MAYKYKHLVLTYKILRRSLQQLDEMHQRIKKLYNYCLQSAAQKFVLKKLFN